MASELSFLRAGVLCAAAMMSTAGRVLSEKMDVLQLAFYTAPVSSCVLMPFFWFLEVRSYRTPWSYPDHQSRQSCACTLPTGLL